MYFVNGIFDSQSDHPKLLLVSIYHADWNEPDFISIYQKHTGLTLYEIEQNKKQISELFEKRPIILSNFKDFIIGLGLDIGRDYQVYDLGYPKIKDFDSSITKNKINLLKDLSKHQDTPIKEWQRIVANSQLAYRHLELKGFELDYEECHPTYSLTYSGRSKCLRHNIQGLDDKYQIKPLDKEQSLFIHFDWVAADFRVASILSKDPELERSYCESDPYSLVSKELGEISREECKIELLKCLYSLYVDNPILEFYPRLKEWIVEESENIQFSGFSHSVLGRRFELGSDRTRRSVFNAIIQGSVAHAMQLVLYKTYKRFPQQLMAEIHDSLVMACQENETQELIKKMVPVMQYPFVDIIPSNPKFPVKVSIGAKWRQWELFKEFR